MLRALGLSLCLAAALAAPAWAQVSEREIDALVEQGQEAAKGLDIEAIVMGAEKAREDAMQAARDAAGSSVSVKDAVRDEYGFDMGPQTPTSRDGEGRLYIFVSLSMPDDLIQQYLDQALKHNGRVVIRGFYKGSFAETTKRLAGLISEDEIRRIGVNIDPRAFETFGVETVPAIALAEKPLVRCETEDCVLDVGAYDIIYGAVSVEYALERFASQGDVRTAAVDLLGYKR